jgi:hypothetical protein
MPTKDNKHIKDTRGGMLGRAKRAIGGRQQQLDDAEARAMGKDLRKPKKDK